MGLGLGFPCCDTSICPIGEELWFDDFSSYSSGETLTPYGYESVGNAAKESGGSLKTGQASEGYESTTYRRFPFDPTRHSRASFEAALLQAADVAQQIELFGTSIIMRSNGNGTTVNYAYVGGSGTLTPSGGISNGDRFKIVAEMTAYDVPAITFDVDIELFINDVSIHTGSSTIAAGTFCDLDYGVRYPYLSDDWNFSVNFKLIYPEYGTPPVEPRTHDWFFVQSSSESISPTLGGGSTPFTYSVNSGSLPAGTSLNSSTGVISGTATTVQTGTVAIRVTDTNGVSVVSPSYTWSVVAGA